MSNKRYNFSEQQEIKLNAKLIYIAAAKYEGDWHSTLHTHHCTELFYVIRGKGNFIVEDEVFDVKKDDLVIVNPNIEHTEVSLDSSPLEYIVLGIEGLTFSSDITDLNNNYNIYNYQHYKHEVLFYLEALLREVEAEESDYNVVCQNLLEVLIINMVRRTNYALSITASKKMNKECAFIKRYIDSYFSENITLDKLSELSHMNKYYLVHAFKKYIGLSPINYLIEVRIQESKNLLETTNYSISQISNFIGFSSQSYFSQSFKKNTGQTPNEYRKSKKIKA